MDLHGHRPPGLTAKRRTQRQGLRDGLSHQAQLVAQNVGNNGFFLSSGGTLTPQPRLYCEQIIYPSGAGSEDDSEVTPFPQLYDGDSLTVHSVKRVKSTKPGVTRALVTQVDKNGDRMLYYVTGADAEDMLERFKTLDDNPMLKKIYRQMGASILRQELDRNP